MLVGEGSEVMGSESLAGDPRREFWRGHLKGWKESDRTQVDYCRRENLSLARFHYWKRQLAEGREKSQLRFVSLEKPLEEAEPKKGGAGIRLHCEGSLIEVDSGFDGEVLVEVIKILRSL